MKTNSNSTNHPDLFLGIDVGKADLFCHLLGLNALIILSEESANS